ncbi:hypothetical protein [Sulfuricaulis limicola]|nr:hypothetical protein [Sulfuricaulis limicola]
MMPAPRVGADAPPSSGSWAAALLLRAHFGSTLAPEVSLNR